MKYNKLIKRPFNTSVLMVLTTIISLAVISCDPTISSLEYDLAEANSKSDETPPSASFSSTVTDDYLTYTFANSSSSATDYLWDFGDGNTSTDVDGMNTYPDVGTYTITLTASDKLNVTSTYSETITVVEPEEPPAINPEIINGDFSAGQDDWKIASFTGGTTSAFNASSDGDPLNYDGSDSGSTKTPGAKWTSSTSAGPSVSEATRYAYQAITVSPDTEYVIEFSHAIKTDKDDIEGGDRVIVEILDGQFTDGVDAVLSSEAGALVQVVGDVANGKGDFKIMTGQFTSNSTGQIAIWIYAITNDELYVDNVKVYPSE